jgi:hypothetical protein
MAVVLLLLLGTLAGGGWYAWDQGWLPFLPKESAVSLTPPPPPVTPPVTPVVPVLPDPPPPPPPRQVVVVLTGEWPDKDGDITFPGTTAIPLAVRREGRIEYTFTLPAGAAGPQPAADATRYRLAPVSETSDRLEFKLTRVPPPAAVRLRFTQPAPRRPEAVTIAGQSGTPDGHWLLFTRAAKEEDGSFQLDTPTWRVKSRARAGPGLWEAELEIALQKVILQKPSAAALTWSAVTFHLAKPDTMPDLKPLSDQLGAASVGDADIKFTLDPDDPQPLLLPAGDYTLQWKSTDLATPPRDGGRFTVPAGQPATLPVPPPP